MHDINYKRRGPQRRLPLAILSTRSSSRDLGFIDIGFLLTIIKINVSSTRGST